MVIRDVTHQRALELRLRQSEKMEAMGQMTAGIAHNFNNMTLLLLAHTEELSRRFVGLEAMAHVRSISDVATRTAALAKQLMGFSKSGADQAEVFSLADGVGAVLPMVDTVTTSMVAVTADIDPSSPEVNVNRSRLDQVVVNIAVNAKDAIPANGALHVRVRGVQLDATQAARLGLPAGHYGMLEMSDTGVGMDAATRARIFEPFFTTKERGTGLGLATVQAAVAEMGGAIDVASIPGRGTTFRIFIPAYVRPA
jgi:C4-dicarboxylate-specific signal transduction histidine kinase